MAHPFPAYSSALTLLLVSYWIVPAQLHDEPCLRLMQLFRASSNAAVMLRASYSSFTIQEQASASLNPQPRWAYSRHIVLLPLPCAIFAARSEEHTSELQSQSNL